MAGSEFTGTTVPGTLTGTLDEGDRADRALAKASGLSRERIKTLIAQGKVAVAGAVVRSASARVGAGAAFAIEVPPPEPLTAEPQAIPLDIVFEDEHLVIVDKPAGMVVHPAAGNRDGTLVNALLHHCRGRLSGINGVVRPGIVHRIDKDTSGLLVVAKTDTAHEGLARQFADHSIDRSYLAVCAGHPNPAAGTVSGRIGRSDANRKKMAVLPPDSQRGKHAVTHYRTVKLLDGCALIECRLETGRTTRCAFIVRQSAIRYWVILSMDAHPRPCARFSGRSALHGRRSMPRRSVSTIRSPASGWNSGPNCPPTCGNSSTKPLVEIDEMRFNPRTLRPICERVARTTGCPAGVPARAVDMRKVRVK
jgi:23S rRNA pseudouridine1911/1915/1917 synthase